MEEWRQFCISFLTENADIESIRNEAGDNFEKLRVYPDSIQFAGGSYFFIAVDNFQKALVVYGEGCFFSEFEGYEVVCGSKGAKVCELSNKNCRVIRRIFPFINPSNHRGTAVTVGLGDRLGLASAGHIRLIKGMPVFPVLAQQSVRELNLTGRTFEDVLTEASWAVFQEGYTERFGADGDHLKTKQEVKTAVNCGYTMITLDCSEHIDNGAASLLPEEAERKYLLLPKSERELLESQYIRKDFILKEGAKIAFKPEDFKKIILVYLKAVKFAIDIYNDIIRNCSRDMDFEISIDETLTSTTPESHFFVASELIAAGVKITSLAPRFCGEFQKGIDYKGDTARFAEDFTVHVNIAEHFGYKISVHSGSDKFSIFPAIGKISGGRYHIKTAGTNWLEAVRIIAAENPSLYRRMHKFAVSNLVEARKYYHISANPSKIPDIDGLDDRELPMLMDMDDSRQVLHITYGLILLDKKSDGSPTFKDEIYSTLNIHEGKYYDALKRHIGRHLKELGVVGKGDTST